jgi:hypothetical protein
MRPEGEGTPPDAAGEGLVGDDSRLGRWFGSGAVSLRSTIWYGYVLRAVGVS